MSAEVLHTVSSLRQRLDESRAKGATVGVVLTMGALHEGHLSLIRRAAELNDEVVVTIYVNPTQFGPKEDYSRYPRDLSGDTRVAFDAGANLLFAPSNDEMYPAGTGTSVCVPRFSEGLCGSGRPGHFDGVATVVSKFFNAIGPGTFFFGQKDYQQWKLIEGLAQDLLFPVKVVGMPIVRDPDGLAMSSRNAFLNSEARRRALAIPRALDLVGALFDGGERKAEILVEVARAELREAELYIEYVELRDSEDLREIAGAVTCGQIPLLAIAVRVESTRLIDNVVLDDGASCSRRGSLSSGSGEHFL